MPTSTMERFVARLTAAADRTERPSQLASTTESLLASVVDLADLLGPSEREPDPFHYRQHVVHVDPKGRFSVVALVWLPGQTTPIHDHIAWCATAVLSGQEIEQRFEPHDRMLTPSTTNINEPGTVSLLQPPESDIHRVTCTGGSLAVSLHVYGADIGRKRTSINTVYDDHLVERLAQLD